MGRSHVSSLAGKPAFKLNSTLVSIKLNQKFYVGGSTRAVRNNARLSRFFNIFGL